MKYLLLCLILLLLGYSFEQLLSVDLKPYLTNPLLSNMIAKNFDSRSSLYFPCQHSTYESLSFITVLFDVTIQFLFSEKKNEIIFLKNIDKH